MANDPNLERLDRWVGQWLTEAAHPAFGDLVVHGTVEVEWLEGVRFLIHRARNDHRDFPDSISIIGYVDCDRVDDPLGGEPKSTENLCMHYFDSRGVFRLYDLSVDDEAWRIWRSAAGLSQRFTGLFSDDGDTLDGRWDLSEDDQNWVGDLRIIYRRRR